MVFHLEVSDSISVGYGHRGPAYLIHSLAHAVPGTSFKLPEAVTERNCV